MFTTLDLTSGYWQTPVAQEDRCKTAFLTHDGPYEFIRPLFGLCNAPVTFQRLMDRVLGGLKSTMCPIYLDNILVMVFLKDLAEHNEGLKRVLRVVREAGLTLNKKNKCNFASDSVRYLGHK